MIIYSAQKQVAACDQQLERYPKQREDRSGGATLEEEGAPEPSQEEERQYTAVRLARSLIPNDRSGPDPDRLH